MSSASLHLVLWIGLLSLTGLTAAPLRVVTFNIETNRDTNGNVTEALNDPGTADYNSVRDILLRINADVVCLQELANPDISGGTNGGTSSDVHALAAELGLPHVFIPTNAGVFDFTLRNAILSRHPFLDLEEIGSGAYLDGIGSVGTGGGTAKDVTRVMPAVVVDVPGAAQPATIITLHTKAGTGADDRFRRAVELDRVEQYLANTGLDASDNVIILGDFNLSGTSDTYASEPAGLPGTWNRGTEIALPISYSTDPDFYFPAPYDLVAVDARDLNGGDATFQFGGAVLDFILPSPALATVGSEIYRSTLDVDNASGLPKAGAPLNDTTSATASDHYAVFADFVLEDDLGLSAAVSQPTVAEDDAPGTATLAITLNRPAGNTNTYLVTLGSDKPDEATVSPSSLSFGPGDTTLSVDIVPQADGVPDPDETVTFTASAPGFDDATATITVLNVDLAEYVFSSPAQTITENFDALNGTDDPLNWTSDPAGGWLGTDDGSSTTTGKYAYGTTEFALGSLAGTPTTFTAAFRNDSGGPVTALQIAYDAEQWGSIAGGSADAWSVELIVDGIPTSLGPLAFTADTGGGVTAGTATPLGAVVTGLSIPDGAPFQLRFTATPGPGSGTPSSDVFLNEVHYDNSGGDIGEFVEVVMAPGFTGTAADIALWFYNGSNGEPYAPDSVPLSSFASGDLVDGYQFYSLAQEGIQNGSPDGFALVDTRTNTVLHFLSYEGTFTASTGPAAGLTSTDIGVAQSSSNPVGTDALGLTGTGADSGDLTWTELTGIAHSPGSPNAGQTLATPGAPPQGIAIDNVSVTLLPDTDGDGDPDLTDPDDDNDLLTDTEEALLGTNPLLVDSDGNGTPDGDEDADGDGQSNAAELRVTLTDPLDRNDAFTVQIAPDPAVTDRMVLTFPSLAGRTYTIRRSTDLLTWTDLGSLPGTGAVLQATADGNPSSDTNFFRLAATLD